MPKKSFPLSKVYQLIEPGPVVMLSTAHKKEKNIMIMSWHMMMEFEPPLLGCIIGNCHHSFKMLKSSKECVINIPTSNLLKQVVGCGNSSGETIDKFKTFHLTPMPASQVKAPLIDECYANLECKLIDTKMVNKYGLFIFEVVKAWIDPKKTKAHTIHHQGNGLFMIGGKTIQTSSKMK